jgi:hypothetical protein
MRNNVGPPMTLMNMRLNGVRAVTASCANCGRQADVNVDALPGTHCSPQGWSAAALQPVRREDHIDPARMAYGEPPPGRA